jgi:membrane protease YdiL (CAAX protease family)
MEEKIKGNHEFEPPDIFSVLNNYVLLLFGLTCILSSGFIQQLFYVLRQYRIGLIVAPLLGIIAPVYLITHRFPAGFRKQLRIHRPNLLQSLWVLIATSCVVVIVDYIYAFSQRFMSSPTDYVEGLKELKPEGATAIALTYLGICVLGPVGEEIIFRGIVQRVLARNMGEILALVLAGTFFGVIHLTPQLLLSMIAFGIFLGYLYFVTSNLMYPILAHCALNTVSYIQLILLPKDELASIPPYAEDPWVLGVSIVILAYVLVRMKKGASATPTTPQSPGDSDAG